jgi:hypothetical protein
MEIRFTHHARERMKLRKIADDMVQETVLHPEEVSIGYHNRKLAYRTFERGVLKVVYSETPSAIVIISTIWEKR